MSERTRQPRDQKGAGGPPKRPAETPGEPERSRGPLQPATQEVGGPKGPEPTRYGDWEKGGRCSDF
jgi:hypothetical protein